MDEYQEPVPIKNQLEMVRHFNITCLYKDSLVDYLLHYVEAARIYFVVKCSFYKFHSHPEIKNQVTIFKDFNLLLFIYCRYPDSVTNFTSIS